ncbi:MAG: DUF2142 domain-containing protein [Chitinophagales bacterium]|nr:DUF2142 domain-containing protein [Chitinophagales bacterium]
MKHSVARTPQKLFPIAAFLIGICYVFVTPPFQVPDETNHFYRIIQIAQGDFIPEKRGDKTGGVIPISVVRVGQSFIHKIAHFPDNKIEKATFTNALREPLNPLDTMYCSFPNTCLFTPVSYLPQLLFIVPGLKFELPPIWLIYGGRISSVLISVLLLTIAIRLLPAFHWSFFAFLLLPMFCQQMASLSADAFLNSLSLLLLAIGIRVAFTDNILTANTLMKILPVTLLLACCKSGYLFLILLFLLPVFTLTDKTKKKHWILLVVVLFICAAGISAAWSTVIKGTFSPYGNPDINPDVSIAFIKSNPLQYAGMVVKNLLKNLAFYVYGVVGYLGWLDTKIPLILTLLYLVLIVAVVYAENIGQFEFSFLQHLLLLFIAATTVVIVITSQYLFTGAGGSPEIVPSQGRYFLPIILPLLFIVRVKRFSRFPAEWVNNNLHRIIPAITIGGAFCVMLVIINRYYIH